MKLQVAVSIFAFLINCYDTLGYPSILLPGNYEGPPLPRQFTNGVVACLGLFLLYLTKNEFSNLMKKSIKESIKKVEHGCPVVALEVHISILSRYHLTTVIALIAV